MAKRIRGANMEDIYREYMEQRILIIDDSIESDVITDIVLPIYQFNDEDNDAEESTVGFNRNNNPIKIFINTQGGLASETLSIISAIEVSKTPVYTYALGKAHSGGFFILLSGHKRYAQRYSRLCYHQVQTYPKNGPHLTVCEDLEETKVLQSFFTKITTGKTKITKDQLDEVNSRKLDWYFASEEAITLGIVDELF